MIKKITRIGALFLVGLVIEVYAWEDLPAPGAVAIDNRPYVRAEAMSLPTPEMSEQPAKALSLKEAILLALRNNPDVENSELQRVVDKFALEVAHNAFYPQFTLNGTTNYARGEKPSYAIGPGISITSPIGTQIAATYNNAFLGGPGTGTLTLKQPLFKGAGWDYNTINLANAVDSEEIAKFNFKNSIINAVVAVINSYRALVQDYNNLDIQSRTLLRATQTLKQFELQVRAGKVAPSDLLQQKANLATTRLSMIQQKSSLDTDYQRFLQALGLVSTAKVVINKKIEVSQYKIPNLQESIRLALLNNINYQSALIRERAAERAVVSAKNQARWQLDVTVSTTVGQNSGTGLVPANPSLTGAPNVVAASGNGPSVGFTLGIPINDVNAKQQIINSRIALEQYKLSLQEQKQQLIRDVTNQISQLQNQYLQIKAAIDAVNLQEKNLENARIKLRYGKTTVFEVNQLQDQLLQQQTSLIGNKVQFLNQLTALSQLLGITLEEWGISLRY